jgi:hypothetical protein
VLKTIDELFEQFLKVDPDDLSIIFDRLKFYAYAYNNRTKLQHLLG